jgi:N-methylhydantoinase B
MQAAYDSLAAAREALLEALKHVPEIETEDVGCALLDARGHVVLATGPLHAYALRAAGRRLAGAIRPGDVYVLNDPFADGSHVQDFTVLVPRLRDGAITGLAACRAHLGDVGGCVYGGYNDDAFEVWQEGVRVTPLLLRRNGRTADDAEEALMLNSRTPDALSAGVRALVSAAETIAGGCGDADGAATQQAGADRAELTARLAAAASGEPCRAEVHGPNGEAVAHVELRLEQSGTRPVLDLTGSSAQAGAPVNAPLAASRGVLLRAVLERVGWDRALTEGVLEGLEVTAPAGLVVSATLPAATGRCFESTGGALALAAETLLSPVAADAHRA